MVKENLHHLGNIKIIFSQYYCKRIVLEEYVLQEILYICALSLGSIVVLFLLTKIMGYRQMSELSMFDYVNGITIGSIAAEMSTSLDENFVEPLVAMIVYGVVSVILAYLSTKSMAARKIITGKPLILMDKGTIYEKNLKKAKIDINEFLTQCRVSGYFDVSKIQTAILEDNGKVSFLPLEADRPATPSDLNIEPKQEMMSANLVIDGKILWKNLRHAGKDENWLMNQLKANGADDIKDVILATCSDENKLNVFVKTGKQMNLDVFM
ncbi:MAG: DUF421 domain-containing protein [Lachnospiraceae bacterium]|nr:DUF421 domain-containing protein [Lachnospiraceae bacterium]